MALQIRSEGMPREVAKSSAKPCAGDPSDSSHHATAQHRVPGHRSQITAQFVPVTGALLRAALVASCFLGAFPPVLFLAVCFVRAILDDKLDYSLLSSAR